MDHASTPPLKWYQGLDRYCWVVLIIAALGWLFDTMDQNLYNLVRAPSLAELLHPHPDQPTLTPPEKAALNERVRDVGGLVTAIFIFGWATGGLVFGMLGDRLGRTKTMILTILVYAAFTGSSGLVHSWPLYAVMRFMTGMGVGGEWAAGAALVAEVFPTRSRPMALGFLQALSSIGNMLASVVTLGIGDLDHRWRWAYFIGTVPALLVLWIRRSVKEPDAWKEAKEKSGGREMGNILGLFSNAILRRNTLVAVMMAMAGGIGLWGAGFFSTDLLREELVKRGNQPPDTVGRLVSTMFLLQNLGAFFGIYLFAVFSERVSRRAAFFLWFGLAWLSVLGYYWGVQGSGSGAFQRALLLAPFMGFCTLGPFSGYTVYFPYLYPTRLRATGCGFCYNVARYLVAFGPIILGKMAKAHGYAVAATLISGIYVLGFIGTAMGPETKGKPLPEDKDFDVAPELNPAPVPGQS